MYKFADQKQDKETVFTIKTQDVKFGVGALRELWSDARSLGMNRIALFLDSNIKASTPITLILESFQSTGLEVDIYDAVVCEPNSSSCMAAADFVKQGEYDGIVSIGGGSVMDTAKAANLLSCHGGEILDYVNAPIGLAKKVPGPLLPHIACSTTSGTGAETTGIVVLDIEEVGLKSGISSPYLKPDRAIVDPETTLTLPSGVIASTGFDVLTHAVESYVARPYTSSDRPLNPSLRIGYQGATPYNDIGALAAIRIGGKYLLRAVQDEQDEEARYQLMFAATLAGLAFNSAGVHIPHAMSYSVATLKHEYTAHGYEDLPPMAPHGISVVLNAPAAFRFTGPTNPERHLEVAQAMGIDTRDAKLEDAGMIVADCFIDLIKKTGLPNGLGGLGYSEQDIPSLAEGGFAQQRPLSMSPCAVSEEDLKNLYKDALQYW